MMTEDPPCRGSGQHSLYRGNARNPAAAVKQASTGDMPSSVSGGWISFTFMTVKS